MGHTIVAINPGSTSTKFAAYDGEQEIFTTTIKHTTEDLAPYNAIIEQYKMRADLILAGLREHKVSIGEING